MIKDGYTTREFITQWQESELEFIQRPQGRVKFKFDVGDRNQNLFNLQLTILGW